jgi:hypothetical protein
MSNIRAIELKVGDVFKMPSCRTYYVVGGIYDIPESERCEKEKSILIGCHRNDGKQGCAQYDVSPNDIVCIKPASQ